MVPTPPWGLHFSASSVSKECLWRKGAVRSTRTGMCPAHTDHPWLSWASPDQQTMGAQERTRVLQGMPSQTPMESTVSKDKITSTKLLFINVSLLCAKPHARHSTQVYPIRLSPQVSVTSLLHLRDEQIQSSVQLIHHYGFLGGTSD